MIVFNFFTLLTGICCINLIFIVLYCLFDQERRKALTTLFICLFCIFLSLNLLDGILIVNQVYGPYLKYLDEFSLLLAFPALYFYVLMLTNNRLTYKWQYLLHSLPAVFFLLMWVFPPDSFLVWNRSSWMERFYGQYNNLQFLVYIILIFILLKKNDRVSRELISTGKNGNLKWIKQLLIFLTVLFLVLILNDSRLINGNIIGVLVLIFSYWLGYHTINQKDIYYQVSNAIQMESVVPGKNRYRNSRLTETSKRSYASKVEEIMVKEKPYLNNELTLTSFADKLDMKPIHLSQVLNEEFKENFYTFINRHRIAESQRLLKDNRYQNYSIQAIALEAGFNSMSTFNKAFKEIVGKSPSSYQKG
jgi:AraC-like DNA-binding protein